jgi:flavodoxin
MKTLVVYYSYEGNSALVAEELKKALGADSSACDLLEIKTQDDKTRTGFAKFLWGGKQVVTHKNPKLRPYAANIDEYDLVILGAPVWAATPAPALQSFIGETKISGKKIGLFVCHAGGPGKALDKLRELLPGNTIAGEADFASPAKQDRAALAKQVAEWAATLQATLAKNT